MYFKLNDYAMRTTQGPLILRIMHFEHSSKNQLKKVVWEQKEKRERSLISFLETSLGWFFCVSSLVRFEYRDDRSNVIFLPNQDLCLFNFLLLLLSVFVQSSLLSLILKCRDEKTGFYQLGMSALQTNCHSSQLTT